MGAFIGKGEIGIWASNDERDAFLDWFAENRCSPSDERWRWCKSEAQRWAGRCIDLDEFLQAPDFFQVDDLELQQASARYGPDVSKLLKHIAEICRGEWQHRVDSKEAIPWRTAKN